MSLKDDEFYMRRALALAEEGRGRTHPNPMVGCLIVKNGAVVGEGWHGSFGGPHAEAVALRRAGKRAQGATLYVTLEPCRHWGQTPPCSDAVQRAGIKRVVAAMKDPNPVSGNGLDRLRRAGIRVETGVLRNEARFLNRAFVKRHETGLPYVLFKAGQTLDGKIASRSGVSRWITGPLARELGHRLRAESDAILVGAHTVRKDNPRLTSHGKGPDPVRLVVSKSLDLPVSAKIFKGGAPTWVITGPTPPAGRKKRLEKAGIQLLTCPLKNGDINLMLILKLLAKMNINQILLEGGGRLSGALLDARLLDEVYLFLAPRLLGGRHAVPSVAGGGWPHPNSAPRLDNMTVSKVGGDILVHGFVKY
ncbi:MAG TPA: bifunctional diaminohydroxyphosphoribosylaminopyrimidine deaminase/5-amino-6-(5-phosphoribosylamino)uracil reductase RibD [Elusimicrobiota bacterium]|nr:bifunctional diaminohydroxyphosphoribosylaminopyrimidine deaminase/5-amino-6-(5-phosphoribosylamino)uracil reductase RibD [Elusimicrobiota bacterium]